MLQVTGIWDLKPKKRNYKRKKSSKNEIKH